jgi:hypothetical protein
MITPSYSLTATERVLPRLALNFTTAALDPRVTFTRTGNTATVTNSSGVIVDINADLPRFDFDPVTLVCRGLLIEEPRTNSLLNSLIDGTSLATQSVTVTAAARTLSFYGTGQIVLSGAASATVSGTGAYPARTTLTFTPSAGTLTLTVTGTVQFAQLELGSFATSFIPTAAAAVTRNADVATMTGTNFSDWYNATEGTFLHQSMSSSPISNASNQILFDVNDGTTSNRFRAFRGASNGVIQVYNTASGSTDVTLGSGVVANQNIITTALSAYKTNNFGVSANASVAVVDNSGAVISGATNIVLNNGYNFSASTILNGWLSKFQYWPQRLTDNELRAFSK